MSCPTSCHLTNMTGRTIEELMTTNNIMLRLVVISENHSREVPECVKSQQMQVVSSH